MSYVRPISISPEHFKRNAIPRLERLARVEGTFVALNERSFSASFSTLFCEASRMGAGLLPRAHQDDLEGWLHHALLKEIECAERVIELSNRATADIEANDGWWCGVTVMPRALDAGGAA
jgi:hypothetical protein